MQRWGILLLVAALALASCASLKSDQGIAGDLDRQIQANNIKGVSVATTDRGVTITAGELNFPPDSAEITPETAARLDSLGQLLKSYKSKKVLIEGHTAAVGDEQSQIALSKARAQAVADYFVKSGYAKAENIVVEGRGGSVPLASNETDEGKAKNRRVEITLLR